VLCNQPVNLPATCLNVSGNANFSVYGVYNDQYSSSHRFIVNWANSTVNRSIDGVGTVTVSLEAKRQSVSDQCNLYLGQPCLYNNVTLYDKVSPVPALTFYSMEDRVLQDQSCDYNITEFSPIDNFAWQPDSYFTTQSRAPLAKCEEQLTGFLPPEFFFNGWTTYRGYQRQCSLDTSSYLANETLSAISNIPTTPSYAANSQALTTNGNVNDQASTANITASAAATAAVNAG
jgi:hypothetical protein